MNPVITIENLTKVYGEVTVVNDISLQVQRAEIFGLVDHNSAGKTTTIECLKGFRTPTFGRIHVLGVESQPHPQHHPATNPDKSATNNQQPTSSNQQKMAQVVPDALSPLPA